MSVATTSRKEAIWLGCKAKTCCHNGLVVPTGRDVWRISRTLDTPPWSFLQYFQSPTSRRDAFALDRSGRLFRLVLAKQPSRRTKTPSPCIFLMRTRDGDRRCGLGDLRPQVCKTFPVEVSNGILCVQPNHGCSCRSWSLVDVDMEEEQQLMEQRLSDAEEYHEVVEYWNAQVMDAPDEVQVDFVAFCEYLLQTYDDIEGARAMEGAE